MDFEENQFYYIGDGTNERVGTWGKPTLFSGGRLYHVSYSVNNGDVHTNVVYGILREIKERNFNARKISLKECDFEKRIIDAMESGDRNQTRVKIKILD